MIGLRPRWFAYALLLAVTLTLSGVAGFNWFMDAFGLFDAPKVQGVNADKIIGDVRMTKTWRVTRSHYDGVILGTSRAEVGLSPQHAGWQGLSSYNFAMQGASLYEIYRNLQHAQAAQPLKQVLLGLDFFNFSVDHRAPETFVEQRLLVDSNNQPQEHHYYIRDVVNVLFSEDGYKKSLETWRTNRYQKGPTHEADGQISQPRWFAGIRRQGGFRPAFEAFEKNYMRKGGNWLASPDFGYRFHDPVSGHSTFDTFEDLLVFCHERNIRLVLFTSPIHARLQLGLYVTGLWDEFADWKRLLVSTNESVARRYGREPFVMIDFATISPYTEDPLPVGETRETVRMDGMRWYWDAAHYKSGLGDVIQDRVFFGTPAPEAADFGQALVSEGLEPSLEQQRQALRRYRERFPQEWQAVLERARSLNTLKVAAEAPLP
ncbi:MAG: hypothetical protein EP312_03220 [Gammaproteobacteria bacterium]|nr:MAG: hypothetical protein EP312_03220 [Gammaproteobacteria bacterium]